MIKVTIKGGGLERFGRRISNRANFLGTGGMHNVLEAAAEDLRMEFQRTIRSFTPGPVPDLAASTKKQKQAQVGFIYPILARTYTMMNSMYMRVRKPTPARGWTIQLGFSGSQNGQTNARIAEIHINGEGRMPKRDFTKIPGAWRRRLMARIRDAYRRL